MSGQDAIKGFVYQTIIAILDSLQDDWKTILIEPKGQERIDIIWTNEDDTEIAYQIKHSKNDFDKSKILDCISGLYKDHSTAKEYKVILIGSANNVTKSFFTNIKNTTIDDFAEKHKILHSKRDKIVVQFYPPDIKLILDAIITRLERFLENKGKKTELSLRELIAKRLVADFLLLSSVGQVLTKTQFESELLKWIKGKYPHIDNLSLAFYLTNKISFSDTFSALKVQEIVDHEYVKAKKKILLNLIEKVNSYSLSEEKINRDCVDEYDQRLIKRRVLKYLNQEIGDDFFNFGGLEVSRRFSEFSLFYNIEYLGKEDEKEKMRLFNKFKYQLENFHDLFRFWKKIQQFYFLPIVLKNEGNTYQNGLVIKLIIPENVKLVEPLNFSVPKQNEILKELNQENSVLANSIRHFKDSVVNESLTKKWISTDFDFDEKLELERMISLNLYDETKFQEERFYKLLNYYFDFLIFHDREGRTIVEFEIEELKAKEAISLPSFIFFKAKDDFSISYEIISNNLPQKVEGILNVKI